MQVLLVVAFFKSNYCSFTMILSSILYETTAKLVKLALNLLFTALASGVADYEF